MKRSVVLLLAALPLFAVPAAGQQISKEELVYLTPAWDGERFEDGRPAWLTTFSSA